MPKPRRLAALGAFAAAVLAGLVVEWAKDFPVTSWTWRGLVTLWRWLRGHYVVERWYLGLLFLLAIGFVVWTVGRALVARAQPPWLEYRKDTFLGLEWHWDYIGARLDPGSLHSYCPRCELRLQFYNASVFAAVPHVGVRCADCGYTKDFEGDIDELRDRLARLIERNIRVRLLRPTTD